jgi:hypothetical protein
VDPEQLLAEGQSPAFAIGTAQVPEQDQQGLSPKGFRTGRNFPFQGANFPGWDRLVEEAHEGEFSKKWWFSDNLGGAS